jgi:uncharacterized membrane protein
MEILWFNALWMVWNAFLAVLPVFFALCYLKVQRAFPKFVLAILWLLFLPNSLYVISDMEHIVTHWVWLGSIERLVAIVQYAHLEFIGLTAFLFSMYALERELRRLLKKPHPKLIATIIISLNFLTGFAMVVGKVERVNSWDVFSATDTVIKSFWNILSSDVLVWLAILFGLFGNFLYFLFRDPLITSVRKVARAERLTKKRGVI